MVFDHYGLGQAEHRAMSYGRPVLVIDDLAELSDLEDLWPSGASGRVLITSRLPASAFEDAVAEGGPSQGSTAEGKNLRVVPVSGLNRREALDYVTSRLSD